jgi:hypothetical protein
MNDSREYGGSYSEPPSFFREELRVCSECQNQLLPEEMDYGTKENIICAQCYKDAMDSNLQNEI